MFEILDMLLIGFVVGLTGALVPGPMLFVTIDSSLKRGWIAGPQVFLGHAMIEFLVCLLIIYGMTSFIGEREMSVISIVGGSVLIVFGVLTVKQAGGACDELHTHNKVITNPVYAGFLSSASNPYFWVWWMAAGSALVLKGLEAGILTVVFFMIGHWLADIGWFTAVSASFSRGRGLMSAGMYQKVLFSCGVFLIGFGAWFIVW